MSVRKRKWITGKGIEKEAWIVDYVDGKCTRRLKTFARKKDADRFAANSKVEIHKGVHVADSASITVSEAGELWIAASEAVGLEKSTINQYRQHLDLHIAPLIGSTLLSRLNAPAIRAFEDELHERGRSPAMVRKVMVSLGSILADAGERGLVLHNAVRDIRRKRRKGLELRTNGRQKGRIKVGVDIPEPTEIKAIVGALSGRWRAVLLTAIFTGMRASELRGLRWLDVDIDRNQIRVHQRADRFNKIGAPKSRAGERTIPAPPIVINALREWKLACPKGEMGLVFPNGRGNVESLANIRNRGLIPAQIEARVVDANGRAKYPGLHCLRHFYASWCINRKEDGGLGLPPKVVQERLGHSSIMMTMDVYGHLFPRGDDAEELATAQNALLA